MRMQVSPNSPIRPLVWIAGSVGLIRALVLIPLLQFDQRFLLFFVWGAIPLFLYDRNFRLSYLSFSVCMAGFLGLLSLTMPYANCALAGLARDAADQTCLPLQQWIHRFGLVALVYVVCACGGLIWLLRLLGKSKKTGGAQRGTHGN